MRRLLRAALSLLFVAGLLIALWPLGQTAYARWNQHRLHTAWRDEAPRKEHRSTIKSTSSGQKPRNARSAAASPRSAVTLSKSATDRPPAASEWPPTRIVIPEIGLDAVVLQGWDDDTLRRGPGHKPDSGLPGQAGNCVIAAHRNVYGAWFSRVDALLPGSVIQLRTPRETFTYHVALLYSVADTDWSVVRAPAGQDAPPRLTLITCTVPRTTDRIAVVAQLAPPEVP